jgi:Tfp pilus assembly protein PilP
MDGRENMILRPPPKPIGDPVLPYVLTGTMTIGGQMVAQIENIVTGESYFLRVGDEIGDNFKVKEIKRDTVILSGAKGKDIVLKLGEMGE